VIDSAVFDNVIDNDLDGDVEIEETMGFRAVPALPPRSGL
jgi:hypothetical protein